MFNKAILIGRLVDAPQLRYTQQGVAVANFTLAVNRPFLDKGGERAADFIDIATWRKLAETCANHLEKGRLVAVEGRIEVRSYDDSNGVRRKAFEVVASDVRFLDKPSKKNTTNDDGVEYDEVPF